MVGVVGDVLHQSLSDEPQPTFYASAFQFPQRSIKLIARVADPSAAARVEQALLTANPDAALSHLGTMTSLLRRAEADSRFRALLVAVFAALATLLAAVGLFGVTSRAVASRSRELGIRAALGATAQGLQSLILREGFRCLAVGIVLGLVGAGAAARTIGHLLFQVRPDDPQAYLLSTLVISTACLFAAWIPARRVSRIEPREVMAED